MTLSRTNMVLGVLLVGVVIVIASIQPDPSKPNFEFLPDMKYSPASSAYDANPNFPNGRTLQRPVEGTIARGPLPLHYAATTEDAVRAGEELVNPITHQAEEPQTPAKAADAGDDEKDQPKSETEAKQEGKQRLQASIQRGGEQFRIFCVSCHGPKGAGDGPVPKRGFPPPPSLLTGKSVGMKDGQLFHILTYGQGSMASFAPQLTPDRRWDLINFVRSLQAAAPPVSPSTSPDTTAAERSDDDATSDDATSQP